MNISAEIDVVENLYRQAKFLRTSTKNDPHKAKAAADWEIRLLGKLEELKAEAAKHHTEEAA